MFNFHSSLYISPHIFFYFYSTKHIYFLLYCHLFSLFFCIYSISIFYRKHILNKQCFPSHYLLLSPSSSLLSRYHANFFLLFHFHALIKRTNPCLLLISFFEIFSVSPIVLTIFAIILIVTLVLKLG